ncbi:MAG: hypothetical protein K2H75_01510, partial [Muribaculaceae bacterium]|nr:hypothetical protein [Muribaculaceae bacterium]
SQPWRALIDNDTVHFYYVSKSRLSVLDTSIGICHFYETEKYYGHTGAFYTLSAPPAAHDKWKYLVSYRRRDTNI